VGAPKKKNAVIRRVFVTLMLAAAVAVAAGATPASFDPQVTAPLARAIMEGVIHGSNPWPFTPIDAQARLQLRSTVCDGTRRCFWTSED
jgi:hypothetical protein